MVVLWVYLRSGSLPSYYGADKDKEANQLGLLGASFLRAATDNDLKVLMSPYDPVPTEAVLPDAWPQTDWQQQTFNRDSLPSSSRAAFIPVGLSDKELAQIRSNASRHEPTDGQQFDFSLAATTDRDLLSGGAVETAPSPDSRRLWSEVDLLRQEVQQLRVERSEPEAPPTYFSED